MGGSENRGPLGAPRICRACLVGWGVSSAGPGGGSG